MASLLAAAVCAVLAGATTFAAFADWAADLDEPARRRLGFPGRVPVGSTVWRFLIRLDAQVLQAVLTGWLRHRLPPRPAASGRQGRVVIAVDGKLLRGAQLPDGRQVHLLSAYDTVSGLVLAQVCIAAKSNEIPAFTPLLDQLQTSDRWPARSSWRTRCTPRSATPTPCTPATCCAATALRRCVARRPEQPCGPR